jgi:hypothetical protein
LDGVRSAQRAHQRQIAARRDADTSVTLSNKKVDLDITIFSKIEL